MKDFPDFCAALVCSAAFYFAVVALYQVVLHFKLTWLY
jgi:hypothetical protein